MKYEIIKTWGRLGAKLFVFRFSIGESKIPSPPVDFSQVTPKKLNNLVRTFLFFK